MLPDSKHQVGQKHRQLLRLKSMAHAIAAASTGPHGVYQPQAWQIDEQRYVYHDRAICCCHFSIFVVGVKDTAQDDQQH
jgi:hypothetical protein